VGAKTGEGFIRKQISAGEGASKVGDYSPTDKRFTRINHFMADTLFDENYNGDYGNAILPWVPPIAIPTREIRPS
jgi:aminopeptidase